MGALAWKRTCCNLNNWLHTDGFPRKRGASSPRTTALGGTYNSVPPPTFINWQREGAKDDETSAGLKVASTEHDALPTPCIPQVVVATTVQAFTPFPGPRPPLSSAQRPGRGDHATSLPAFAADGSEPTGVLPSEVKPAEEGAACLVVLPEDIKSEMVPPAAPRHSRPLSTGTCGKASGRVQVTLFGGVPQDALPPPMVRLPGSMSVAYSTHVPRPWFPGMPSAGGGRKTPSVEVRPPAPPVEVRLPAPPVEGRLLVSPVEVCPPCIPMEVHPPSSPLEVLAPNAEVSSMVDAEAPASSNWGDVVAEAETSVTQWRCLTGQSRP